MIATKGAARFHSSGFAPPRQPSSAATAPMVIGSGNQPPTNPIHGTKRLASCREELERSWQQGTGPTNQELHYISNASSSEDFVGDCSSRVKRRRTLQYQSSNNYSNDDNDDTMMTDGSFVRGTRISPFNRPPTNPSTTHSQVKAGWYEGEVAQGNRHGRGITKHDDGTEYEGPYVNDIMEGPSGRYQFITTRHLVPNPRQNGSTLHRQIEKSFVGTFQSDTPSGVGMVITKIVDCAPQALCGPTSPLDIRFREVMYDVGMHKNNAVGEGVRIVYTTTNVEGRSTLAQNCFRMQNGEITPMRLALDYAQWMCSCMGVPFPSPSSV